MEMDVWMSPFSTRLKVCLFMDVVLSAAFLQKCSMYCQLLEFKSVDSEGHCHPDNYT